MTMAKKAIRVYNDPVLHKKARPVNNISGTIRKLVEDMFETMYENGGVGLAAPQVGVSRRVFVIDTQVIGEKFAMINPKILSLSRGDLAAQKEGCLSLPEMEAEIARPRLVKVQYLDVDGNERTLEADRLLARAIQHETDHLDGILFVERVQNTKKQRELLKEMTILERGVYA